jgi:uncharacterized protein (DUF427 family)
MKLHDVFASVFEELRHESIERRVRGVIDGETVVDSTRAQLVWEPRRVCPSFAVPAEDIRAPLSPAPASDADVAGVLHPGIPFAVHTADGEPVTIADRVGAGFRLAELDGQVELDFDAFDAWYEEDERIFGHPRDPYHRVDVRLSSRPVRIEFGGRVVAETTRARMAYETQLMTRFYLPREDVRVPLVPSDRRSYCPYKGEASYWSVEGGRNLAWSYEQPLPDAAALKGLVAFWDELVDVYLDGALRDRPGGPFAAALADEFGIELARIG